MTMYIAFNVSPFSVRQTISKNCLLQSSNSFIHTYHPENSTILFTLTGWLLLSIPVERIKPPDEKI